MYHSLKTIFIGVKTVWTKVVYHLNKIAYSKLLCQPMISSVWYFKSSIFNYNRLPTALDQLYTIYIV